LKCYSVRPLVGLDMVDGRFVDTLDVMSGRDHLTIPVMRHYT
jgi:hypothetical protein